MEQHQVMSPPAGEPSWPRVALNTVALAVQRRADRTPDDELLSRRGWFALAGSLVALVLVGAAAFVLLPALGGTGGDAGTTTDAQTQLRVGDRDENLPGSPSASPPSARSSTGTARSQADPAGADARALAGAELATRPGLQTSARAIAALRSGAVDGRVLLVLATLAADGRLTEVDVPPAPAAGGTGDPGALEFAAVDIDGVLVWLDTQPALVPDRVQVRREDSATYVRLEYDTPEPPGLFAS